MANLKSSKSRIPVSKRKAGNANNSVVRVQDFDPAVELLNSRFPGGSDLSVPGNVTVTGNTTLNGNVILGSDAADTITINGTVLNITGGAMAFEGATADGFEAILAFADPTADSTYTVPNVGTSSFAMTAGTQTIGGAKTFSSQVLGPAGGFASPSFAPGLANMGIYQSSPTELGIAASGAFVARASTAEGIAALAFQGPIGSVTPAAGTFTTLGASGLITGSASAAITTGATALNLGSDASTGAINIGTGAAARIITMGFATGASAINLNSTEIFLSSTGVIKLNSSGQSINIGDLADAQPINIGTGAAARTVTVGNTTGATTLIFNSGSGNARFNTQVDLPQAFATVDGKAISPMIAVTVTVTAAALDAGGNIVVFAAGAGDQVKVEDVKLIGGGTNYGAGGDRTIVLTDGTTTYTTVANGDIEAAPATTNAWGSAIVPFSAGTADVSTVAGTNLRFQYAGGTTDHGGVGSIKFRVLLTKVA